MNLNLIVLSWLLVLPIYAAQISFHDSDWVRIDPRSLVTYSDDEGATFLKAQVGKRIVENLLKANGPASSTTSCRLENKCIVDEKDLQNALDELLAKGYDLEDREVKNLPRGAKAGTFTFYGTSIKFRESRHLPKTSIKMRIRAYIIDDGQSIKRSPGTENSAFLEIKIKNPYPDYPLSVHKYRLVMPDQEILELIRAEPGKQKSFFTLLRKLAASAHARDKDNKNGQLIDAIFEELRIMAIAEPSFIRPFLGITYFRASKKYDEDYEFFEKKKLFKRARGEIKTRSYEITIDESVQAFEVDFTDDTHSINIEKYFTKTDNKKYALAQFPKHVRIIEFKQPDAVGYDGPGHFREPHKMTIVQRDLWQAFVGGLQEKAWLNTSPDSGKFFHVKQYVRIRDQKAKEGERTALLPGSIEDLRQEL